MRELERYSFGEGFAYTIRHHAVLTAVLGVELRQPPLDSSFRDCCRQGDVAALCAAIRDWTIVQIPGGAEDLDQLVLRHRGQTFCGIQVREGAVEPIQGLIRLLADRPQRSSAENRSLNNTQKTGRTFIPSILKSQIFSLLVLRRVIFPGNPLELAKIVVGSDRLQEGGER